MKKINIEIVALIIITILNFFLIKKELSSLVYVFLFIPLSLYYFPIKPIVLLTNKEKEGIAFKIVSCFIISLSITLAYLNYLIGHEFMFVKITYLIELIVNLFLVSYFIPKKDKTYVLHLIILFLNAMCYFGN